MSVKAGQDQRDVAVRKHPQKEGLPVLQYLEGRCAHRLFGALAAHESLDAPVGQHEGVVAGPRRGRRLGADHCGVDERNPPAE